MDSTFGEENMRDIASSLVSIAASLQKLESIAVSLQNIEQSLQPKNKKKDAQPVKEVGRPKIDWKLTAYIWYRSQRTYMKAYAISVKYGVSESVVRKIMTLVDNPAMVEYKRQTGLEAKGEQWLEWLNRELPDDMKKEEYM